MELKVVVREFEGLVLGMHVDKAFAQTGQHIQGYRAVIYKGPGFTAGVDLPPEDRIDIIVQVVLLEKPLKGWIATQGELGFHNAFTLLVPEGGPVSPLPEDQGKAFQQDRLAGPGFPGNGREAFLESDLQVIDKGVILYG
jgi:hypothetical protein